MEASKDEVKCGLGDVRVRGSGMFEFEKLGGLCTGGRLDEMG